MTFFLRFGAIKVKKHWRLPQWVSILVMAEQWGVTPWSITGEVENDNTRLVWYFRFMAYNSAKIEAEKMKGNGSE